MKYGIIRDVSLSYDEAVEKVRATLAEEGFGILTEIDVKAVLKKKLDRDFRRYIILGACNPEFAHRALTAEVNLGLLLPCNVIVYEDDSGGTKVAAMDPAAAMAVVDNPAVAEVALEVRAKLERAIDNVE